MDNETRNNYQQYDLLEIMKNLETKIKKGIHVASMAVVISIDDDNVKCMPFPIEEDTDTKVVSAYNLTQATFNIGDKVLLIYTDRDFRYNKDSVTTDSNSVTETSNATLHSDLYGIVLPKTFGQGTKGNDGVGIRSVYTYYALSDDNENKPAEVGDTKTWSTKAKTVNAAQRYLWSYQETNLTSGDSYNSEPVVSSTYGKDGKDGISVSSVEEYYLATNTTTTPSIKDFILDADVVDTMTEEKPYLWNYEKTTIGTETKCTTPALIGKWSSDGRGIVSITNYYEKSTSNTIIPHDYLKETDWSSWKTKAPELDSEYKYLWNFEVVEYNKVNSKNETKEVTMPSVIGIYGDTGISVNSVKEYYLVSKLSSGVINTNTDNNQAKEDWKLIAKGDKVPSPDSDYPYLWNYEETYGSDGKKIGDSTEPAMIGKYSKDGLGISIVQDFYLASSLDGTSSSPTKPIFESDTSMAISIDNGWSDVNQPTDDDKPYLWNFERVAYAYQNDPTTIVRCDDTPLAIIGTKGKKGVSLTSITEFYMATSSTSVAAGEKASDGSEWVDVSTNDMPTLTEEKKYLWNYEISYLDGKASTPTKAVLIGTYSKDGNGIKSITDYYATNNDKNNAPTISTYNNGYSGWSTIPPTLDSITNKYLWNFERIEYTKSDPKVTDPSIIGAYGDTGESGRGISKVVTQYALSADLTEPTEWDEAKKTPDSTSKYLWQRSRTEYTKGDPDDWTSPQVIGIFGKDGSDATVDFVNVCAALGITEDATNKGLYKAKDSDGNDTLAINANAIYTDSLWAEKIQAVEVTTEQLKSVTISASQLDITPTSYKYINNYNTLADWRSNSFKLNIINTDTFKKNEGSMSVYGEYYTSTTTYAGTSKNMDIYPDRLYFTIKTYTNGPTTISPTSTEYCLNFPSTGAYEKDTDELDGDTGNNGTIATREYVKGYLSAVLTGDETVINSKCSYALHIGNANNNYTYDELANLFDNKSDSTHTHNISLTSGNTTSSITLASSQKYTLTAGGQSITFTTPSDNNTWRGIQNNLTSTSTTDSLSAYQGYLLSNAKVNREEALANDIDLNTVTTSGFYRFQASMKNGPGGTSSSTFCGYGQLLVVHGGGDTISQFVMPYSSSTVYMRNGNAVNNTSGVWQNWVTLVTKDDLSGFCKATYDSSTGVLKLTVS